MSRWLRVVLSSCWLALKVAALLLLMNQVGARFIYQNF
jgi:hypothetical protein